MGCEYNRLFRRAYINRPRNELHHNTKEEETVKGNFVLYRLPHADHYFSLQQTVGEPAELCSYADIGGEDGFVFAPFAVEDDAPILLLKPDVVERKPIVSDDRNVGLHSVNLQFSNCERHVYHDVFNKFHSHLVNGDFEKIVLSRCSKLHVGGTESPGQLFKRACQLYPRMFIALVSMQKAGVWLMSTPEILLEGRGENWRTIALAGTMRLTDEQLSFDTPDCSVPQNSICWSDKNIREQRYVASFIRQRLGLFTSEIEETDPYTVRAGRLVHLRSDFSFSLPSCDLIGKLIQELHPTPAVCGIPRLDTYNFIRHNEGFDRKYYSGFSGIISRNEGTNLFVTLRCMQISGSDYSLYAGGGLLRDSIEEAEWAETEAKMDTMRKCFAIKKI